MKERTHRNVIVWMIAALVLGAAAGAAAVCDTPRCFDVAEFSAQFPLVIVMPDGGHDAEAGWYSDWADGSRQWETFHMRTLVRYVDHHFRVLRRGHRAVAGLSMGGFGAMSYAARHRGL